MVSSITGRGPDRIRRSEANCSICPPTTTSQPSSKSTAARPEDAAEIRAITDAMVRLLVGVPLRSDGKLTVKSLAEEAGLRRNKLTHKHTGLKDLFCALTQAQDHRPRIADDLQAANADLTDQLKKVTQERNTLREDRATLARVVHVLEVENDALRTALEAQEGIVNPASRRTAPA
jgi:chromosome segregation ATPase